MPCVMLIELMMFILAAYVYCTFIMSLQHNSCVYLNSPLRIFHATVAALVIAWYGFDHCLVAGGHLHHFDECVIVYF